MLHITEIIGDASEGRFAGRAVENLPVSWHEAGKARLRRNTDAGTDVAIALDRRGYLDDGAVLHDDGRRIVVVIRPPEPALVIRIPPTTDHRTTVQMAALIGHAFGNQHVPLEVLGNEIRLPVTTSESVMRGTLDQLHLHDLSFDFESIALGARGPLTSGAGHGGHDH